MQYRGFAEVGLGLDLTYDTKFAYEITTTHGVLLTSGTFVGAGIGITGFDGLVGLPLYLDARQFLGHRRDRGLFAGMRIGYHCPLNKTEWEWIYHFTEKMKGLLVSPSIGISGKRFDVSLSYLLSQEQEADQAVPYSTWNEYKHCLLLRAGIHF